MRDKSLQKYDCDRCGFTYDKAELKKQRGLLVCTPCFDGPDPNAKIKWGFYGAQRAGSKTVTTITAAGGVTRTEEHMLVIGDGPVTVTADPQIAVGVEGQLLTLEGTSDVNTVTLTPSTGVRLRDDKNVILKDGFVSSFVYTEVTDRHEVLGAWHKFLYYDPGTDYWYVKDIYKTGEIIEAELTALCTATNEADPVTHSLWIETSSSDFYDKTIKGRYI